MGRSISLVKADFLPQCNLSRCFLTSAGSFSRLTSASLPAFIEMLQKHFPQSKVQELLELVNIIGLCIETKSKINICRDAKDNYLLALAKDSQADFLITGDQDLLILQQFGITKIVTYQQFLVICRLGLRNETQLNYLKVLGFTIVQPNLR
ncbi:putative toxin-antitoxin system toxin component, PIN family [Microcystis aeruginosa]|uniref:putative toxin-antitoxin system toxin component, PIN family n=2 Tax=Microcystis aeruginosa TaxID=1126 RepID=UPI0020161F41|nr:putative toxin-antitoxin system toxin component, PIN family [Microcystis aeruginosa]